ncbi:MAG: LysR substrate-binding domain-containing protein [Rhodobacterales bacterium]|jgi:LysR family transcriptional regulator, low CO2-responsive transcriptional regulator
MKYVQLRAFHNVALAGGFSRAAEIMGLTQPALSDQVLKLEQAYDVLLFSRHKKQVSLTEDGERLLDIIRPMFEIEARALEFLTESRSKTTGHLRVIADNAYHVTEILGRFRANYPSVRITLSTGNSQDVVAALEDYRADIGVLGSNAEGTRLLSVSLGATPIIAFCAKGRHNFGSATVPLSALAKHPLVLREQGSKTRQKLEDAAAKQGIELTAAIEAEGREAVREIVASGGGIGFVSEAEFGHDQRMMKIRIAGEAIPMEETVVCLQQRAEMRVIRAFIALAKDFAATQVSSGAGSNLPRKR